MACDRKSWGGGALIALSVLSVGSAWAQDAQQDDDDIVVTAQRRSERAEDVPIAITAVSSDRLEESSVTDTLDLAKVVPGLSLSHDGGTPIVFMRGIGTDITSAGIEPSVATYIDGAYMPSGETIFVDFSNIAQVEVLRGPQGTLFGRNATGGAMLLTTRGPTDEFTASLQATAGNFGLQRVSGFVAGPLSQSVRGSLAGVVHHRDGNYTEIVSGQERNDQDYYSLNARLAIDLSPTAEAEFYAGYYSEDDTYGTALTELSGNSIGAALGYTVATQPFQTATDITDTTNQREVTSLGARLQIDLGDIRFRSRTAFVDYERRRDVDFDLSTARLVGFRPTYTGEFVTQEFLLSPVNAGQLEWVAGLYFLDGWDGFKPPLPVQTSLDLAPVDGFPETPITQYLSAVSDVTAYSAFADATYHLSSEWSVALGLRYSHEEKTVHDRAVFAEDIFGAPFGPSFTFPDDSTDWDSINWRALVSYDNGPLLLYAKAETGFIAGAYNTANPVSPGPVDPEEVTAYEAGFKSRMFNRQLSLEGAVFFNDYENLHVQIVDAATGASILDQAEGAESYGVDLQLRALPTDRLEIVAGVSYLHAEYTDYQSGGVLLPNPPFPGNYAASVVLGMPLDMSGNARPRSPEWTASLAANYTIPLSHGELVASGDVFYTSEIFFDPANIASQDEYALFNARLAYNSSSGFSIALWGKNLTDETYLSSALVGSTAIGGFWGDQQTYGVTIGMDF